ncbi:hypothetical protein F5887DRAFT_1062041 [Amanita rubescens]|nr:hypothetical protein F5887DRAFT_1062041 [Amanita rubescens]
MTFVNSLHKQYLMTSSTIGSLRQAFDVLHHKGLVVQSTKGPFWHNLDEAIHHIAEAHFHACWLEVDLKQKNPDELKAMSMIILETHASQRALVDMQDSRTTAEQDLVQIQWTLWNKDVLPYIELCHAVRAGDIGCMEDLLPLMAFRFSGGGNTNYLTEILELRTGEPRSFLPYDLAQKHNIADIKVHYHSMGPGASMDYLKKISPVIPTLQCIQCHMEKEFGAHKRGSHHSAPEKEADVILLTSSIC